MDHYYCSECSETLSEGEHRPIRHEFCNHVLCALCWIKIANKKKPCPQCKKKIIVKDLTLMIFFPTPSGVVLKQQYDDQNYLMIKQELLDYRVKRQEMIPLGCRKHNQKNTSYDLLKGIFYCGCCEVNLIKNSYINVEELHEFTISALMATQKRGSEILSKVDWYFKDKLYDMNQMIINIYYNLTFEKLIAVLEPVIDSDNLSRIKIVLGNAFKAYNKINSEVYETLSIFKNKLGNFIKNIKQDVEEFQTMIYSDIDFFTKEQFNFKLKSQCDLPLDTIIDSVYADNKKLLVVGNEITINMRMTIFGLLSQNIADSEICENAIRVYDDYYITINKCHYEWMYPI